MPSKKPLAVPPYIGAAYYPEDWPLEQIDEDVALMKEAGMNVMRVAEFAWACMEPEEGRYDFGWLHRAVDKLAEAGIATIMCTPSATPPAWLTETYPETLFVLQDGRPVGHGGRRHTCPNSPVYREFCRRIVMRMAEEFGKDERVIGWQIDNEVAPHTDPAVQGTFFGRSCTCRVCRMKFAKFLAERYGSIDALNEAWCLNLWSQKYDRFSQVPTPDPRVWHHPSLLAAWDEFSSQSYVEFVKFQADLLHEHTIHPIGTDMMPFHEVDHYDMVQSLDLVQFNHYNYREDFRSCTAWFDFLRPLKDRPFWNTESSTCWSGNIATSGYSYPGFCRANTWLPIAMGGEANLYWLWRTHWAGQELLHGSVLTTPGRPRHMFGEVQQTAREFVETADYLAETRPTQTGLGVHFGHHAYVTFRAQPGTWGLNYLNVFQEKCYQPLIRAQFRPDVIDPRADLSPYRLIFSPALASLDHGGLRDRLRAWIEAGGVWVAGPLTDTRTFDGAKYRHAPFSVLEEWGGVYCKYQLPGHPMAFEMDWADGSECEGSLAFDAFEARDAEVLAVYTQHELAGLAAATRRRMGKGQVVVLGTMPSAEMLVRLLTDLGREADVAPVCAATENVLVVPRDGSGGAGAVIVELDNKAGSVTLPRPGVDLLTGAATSGTVEVRPYGVSVVRYA